MSKPHYLEFQLMFIQGMLGDVQRMVVEAGLRGGFSQERREDIHYKLTQISARMERCPLPEEKVS